MTILKRLPINKTIVLSMDTHVVDPVTKSRSLKASHAVPVYDTDVYTLTDVVLSDTTPHVINDVKKAIILSSIGPFRADITYGGVTLTGLHCAGVFTFFGPLDRVALYLDARTDPTKPAPRLRLSCQYV